MPTPHDFDQPLCAETDPELFFIDKKGDTYSRTAINLCRQCVHQTECAEYAIKFYDLDGLWGGLTPSQRNTIRKQRGIRGESITK